MSFRIRRSPLLGCALFTLAVLAAPAQAGPPWISVEYPPNPLDPSTKGALLVIHTYHHQVSRAFPLVAVAEGILNGKREKITLEVRETSRTGVWAIRGELPRGGTWVVAATMDDQHARATALVALGPDRQLLSVQVPHDLREGGRWAVPRRVTQADVDALLRSATAMAGALETVGVSAAPATGTVALAGGVACRTLGAFGGLALLPFALLATVRVVRGPRLRERESSEDDDASADDGACADDVAPEDDA